jgi:hypothetical protein
MRTTGGFALAPQTMPDIFGEWRQRRGCRTGVREEVCTSSPESFSERGTTRFDGAIITPARHRTLILDKVPCSNPTLQIKEGRHC